MKKSKTSFSKSFDLSARIDEYFNYIKGEYCQAEEGSEQPNQKVWEREPEPPTISGLAFFLGFESMEAFVEYEEKGRFAHLLKRARLHIESVYEKKLHIQSSAGAIFALKSLKWNEKRSDGATISSLSNNVKIEIIETGPPLAGSENEVVL